MQLCCPPSHGEIEGEDAPREHREHDVVQPGPEASCLKRVATAESAYPDLDLHDRQD